MGPTHVESRGTHANETDPRELIHVLYMYISMIDAKSCNPVGHTLSVISSPEYFVSESRGEWNLDV